VTIFVGGVQIDIPAGETIQLDVEPPELTVPDDFAQEAQSAAGAVVEFEATATDNLDPVPAVVCVPEPSTLFPLDDTIVECTATDFSGNAATKTFTVTVQDTTPPELSQPDDITEEATSAAGATVDYVDPTATDDVDDSPEVECDPLSGSTFPLDDTIVECTATDFSGNAATKTFTVTVQDTTPPELTVPSDVTIDAADPFGSIYTFSATATDIADPSPTVECTPASGSVFPLGTTTVTCTATDASGNESPETTFDVTVQVTSATFDGFIAKIESLGLQKGIENSLVSKIDAAAKSFEKGKSKTMINQLEAFVNEVNAQDKKKLSEEQAALLLECADLLIDKLSEK